MKEIKDVINEKVFGIGEIAGYKVLYGIGIKDLKSMSHLIENHKPDLIIRANLNKDRAFTFTITSNKPSVSANQLSRYFLEIGIDTGLYSEYTKVASTDAKAFVYANNTNIFKTTCRPI